MSSTEATYATPFHKWPHSQAELHEPYIRVKTLGRGRGLPFDCWTACFRCVVEAS